jgi:hypothetical protein
MCMKVLAELSAVRWVHSACALHPCAAFIALEVLEDASGNHRLYHIVIGASSTPHLLSKQAVVLWQVI